MQPFTCSPTTGAGERIQKNGNTRRLGSKEQRLENLWVEVTDSLIHNAEIAHANKAKPRN